MAWLLCLLLFGETPITSRLSIWRPETLFPVPLAFSLNIVSFPLCVSVLAMFATQIFVEPGLGRDLAWPERTFLSLYSCIGLAAILAKNILTMLVMWTMLDGAALLFLLKYLQPFTHQKHIAAWHFKGLLSILILFASASANIDFVAHEGSPNSITMMTPSLILIACLLRLPWIRAPLPQGFERREDQVFELAFSILPSTAAMALLGQFLQTNVYHEMLPISHILGGSMVIIALLMLFFAAPQRVRRTGLLIFLPWGIALQMASSDPSHNASMIAGLGFVMVCLSTMALNLKIFDAWQRVIPFIVMIMAFGFPLTPAYPLGEIAIGYLQKGEHLGRMALSMIGMAGMAMLFFRSVSLTRSIPISREQLAQLSYSLGLIVLPLSGIIIGILMIESITANSIIFTFSIGLIFGLVFVLERHIDFQPFHEMHHQLLEEARGVRMPIFGRGLALIARVIRSTSNVFEGETGILWVLVILQLLILAFGRFGL